MGELQRVEVELKKWSEAQLRRPSLQLMTCSAVSTAILLVKSTGKSRALVARETHASVPEVPFQSNLKSPKSR